MALYFQTELLPLLVMSQIYFEKCVQLLNYVIPQSNDYTCSFHPLVHSPLEHFVSHWLFKKGLEKKASLSDIIS